VRLFGGETTEVIHGANRQRVDDGNEDDGVESSALVTESSALVTPHSTQWAKLTFPTPPSTQYWRAEAAPVDDGNEDDGVDWAKLPGPSGFNAGIPNFADLHTSAKEWLEWQRIGPKPA
jgi:hypothetical protein